MKNFIPTLVISVLVFAFASCSQTDAVQTPSLETKTEHYSERTPLLLISIDGFRTDYLERTDTPALDYIIANGVQADYLKPSFPSNTFPNHYSLATGLYTENTGVIANNMFDPELGRFALGNRDAVSDGRWYGGEPIWVTAENQNVRTATMFWPGSEAEIMGVRPTRWVQYDNSITYPSRVDSVITWLQIEDETRPEFLTLYFSRVDSRGHSYGVESDSVTTAIAYVDEMMAYLIAELKRIEMWGKLNILVTSDHGMASLSEEKTIFLDDIIDLDDVFVRNWGTAGMIEPREGKLEEVYGKLKAAEDTYGNVFRVYLREDIPERFRFKNHQRVPSILVEFDVPYAMTSRSNFERRGILAGNHGWDPAFPEMHTIFFATGPDFRSGETFPKVRMVDIYELMCHLLDLEPAKNDGNFQVWERALR